MNKAQLVAANILDYLEINTNNMTEEQYDKIVDDLLEIISELDDE